MLSTVSMTVLNNNYSLVKLWNCPCY